MTQHDILVRKDSTSGKTILPTSSQMNVCIIGESDAIVLEFILFGDRQQAPHVAIIWAINGFKGIFFYQSCGQSGLYSLFGYPVYFSDQIGLGSLMDGYNEPVNGSWLE